MDAFNIYLGESGLESSYQENFPRTTPCCRCGGEARIGFVAMEGFSDSQTPREYVADLHDNDPDGDGFWLHDACAVAVYFCRKCLETTALYNQA
jgi:hypothetical protein